MESINKANNFTVSKRNELTLLKKIQLLKYAKTSNDTQRALARKYDISRSQVQRILKKADILLKKDIILPRSKNRKRLEGNVRFKEINGEMRDWIDFTNVNNASINVNLMQKKALDIANQFNLLDFKASNGWLRSFLERNNIRNKAVCGEAGSVNQQLANEYMAKVNDLCEGYEPNDVFNFDETALFCKKGLPRTFAKKGAIVQGTKQSKIRVTLALLVNAIGEKETLHQEKTLLQPNWKIMRNGRKKTF